MSQQYGVNVVPFHPLDWGSRPDSRNTGFELIGMNFSGFLTLKPNISFFMVGSKDRSTKVNKILRMMFSVCRKNKSRSSPVS